MTAIRATRLGDIPTGKVCLLAFDHLRLPSWNHLHGVQEGRLTLLVAPMARSSWMVGVLHPNLKFSLKGYLPVRIARSRCTPQRGGEYSHMLERVLRCLYPGHSYSECIQTDTATIEIPTGPAIRVKVCRVLLRSDMCG